MARGFAGMSEKKRKAIARKGGQMSPGNFKFDRDRAREAGRIGGQHSHDNE